MSCILFALNRVVSDTSGFLKTAYIRNISTLGGC